MLVPRNTLYTVKSSSVLLVSQGNGNQVIFTLLSLPHDSLFHLIPRSITSVCRDRFSQILSLFPRSSPLILTAFTREPKYFLHILRVPLAILSISLYSHLSNALPYCNLLAGSPLSITSPTPWGPCFWVQTRYP